MENKIPGQEVLEQTQQAHYLGNEDKKLSLSGLVDSLCDPPPTPTLTMSLPTCAY